MLLKLTHPVTNKPFYVKLEAINAICVAEESHIRATNSVLLLGSEWVAVSETQQEVLKLMNGD